jgi:hypothetical protein
MPIEHSFGISSHSIGLYPRTQSSFGALTIILVFYMKSNVVMTNIFIRKCNHGQSFRNELDYSTLEPHS